jgi:peptidyl-prolyl cis-trans isomerase B (cyclophilin B)
MKYLSLAIVAAVVILVGIFAYRGVRHTTGESTVIVDMKTNHGTIVLELYPDKAPETVKNFLEYVNEGFYNGTIFHRVIPGFMIQGGGFEPGMKQKPTRAPIKNEADNGLKNDTGTIAMARTPDPNSATAQFFINAKDNGFLNYTAPTPQGWGYCVFGKVIKGMDVVQAIEHVSTTNRAGHQDVPVDDVVIESVAVEQSAGD